MPQIGKVSVFTEFCSKLRAMLEKENNNGKNKKRLVKDIAEKKNDLLNVN